MRRGEGGGGRVEGMFCVCVCVCDELMMVFSHYREAGGGRKEGGRKRGERERERGSGLTRTGVCSLSPSPLTPPPARAPHSPPLQTQKNVSAEFRSPDLTRIPTVCVCVCEGVEERREATPTSVLCATSDSHPAHKQSTDAVKRTLSQLSYRNSICCVKRISGNTLHVKI